MAVQLLSLGHTPQQSPSHTQHTPRWRYVFVYESCLFPMFDQNQSSMNVEKNFGCLHKSFRTNGENVVRWRLRNSKQGLDLHIFVVHPWPVVRILISISKRFLHINDKSKDKHTKFLDILPIPVRTINFTFCGWWTVGHIPGRADPHQAVNSPTVSRTTWSQTMSTDICCAYSLFLC